MWHSLLPPVSCSSAWHSLLPQAVPCKNWSMLSVSQNLKLYGFFTGNSFWLNFFQTSKWTQDQPESVFNLWQACIKKLLHANSVSVKCVFITLNIVYLSQFWTNIFLACHTSPWAYLDSVYSKKNRGKISCLGTFTLFLNTLCSVSFIL